MHFVWNEKLFSNHFIVNRFIFKSCELLPIFKLQTLKEQSSLKANIHYLCGKWNTFYKRTYDKSRKYFQSHRMVFNKNLYKTICFHFFNFHDYILQPLE